MTIRSPLFRKLLFSGFFLILVTVGAFDYLVTEYTAARELDHVEKELNIAGQILADELPTIAPGDLEAWSKRVGDKAGARVTVINPDGVVQADSQHDPETMENHSHRPEVREALAGRRGIAIRLSPTLDIDFCYLALPASYQGKQGVVLRVAVPLQQIHLSIAEVRGRVIWTSLLAALLALAVAYFFSRRFTRRIRKIQAFAEGLANARLSETLAPEPDDELGSLARSLQTMAGQMGDTVDRLRLESARRDAILSSMTEGVLAVDRELRVTFCNEAFARAVGAKTPIAENMALLQLVRDPTFLGLFTRVLATREPVRQKMSLGTVTGRTFEVNVVPIEHRPRGGALAILYDVTELERLERVRKDFVANVSHELRTPLAAIRGYAETLLDGALEDKENNRHFLDVIRSHAMRLTNIASDLSVLSDLESDKPDPEPERIAVRDAFETAMQSVEPEAVARKVRVIFNEIEDVAILGHRLRLEQALVNLLHNAIKFNRPDGEVHLAAAATPDGKVQITISDTGIGIPSEDLPRIFERFYRVDKARSREVGGTGLGLSIVRHVVERSGGSISVESQLGKGSTFTLLFSKA